jgi:hypothetical protein
MVVRIAASGCPLVLDMLVQRELDSSDRYRRLVAALENPPVGNFLSPKLERPPPRNFGQSQIGGGGVVAVVSVFRSGEDQWRAGGVRPMPFRLGLLLVAGAANPFSGICRESADKEPWQPRDPYGWPRWWPLGAVRGRAVPLNALRLMHRAATRGRSRQAARFRSPERAELTRDARASRFHQA